MILRGDLLQEVEFSGAGNSLRAAGDAQLAVDVVDVRFDGVKGQHEFVSDLAVGVTSSGEAQDFQFAFGEGINLNTYFFRR